MKAERRKKKMAMMATAKQAFSNRQAEAKVGRMVMRDVGECWGDPRNGVGRDDNKTLDELHFEIGDYLDAAIYVK